MRFKNNIVRNMVIDGQKIINSAGKNLGAVIVMHDVTELKHTEKLKNEFVSIVSHELRTPLTSIRGSLGLLVNGIMGDFPDKVKNLLEIANNNCDRLLLLINDILDIEKIEAGKMDFQLKTTDINCIVKESVDINQMYAEKFGVSIELTEPEALYFVTIDSDRIMQVLANLISNACKFSPKNDKVTVAIKPNGSSVRVSISNRGSGISEAFQSRIFQKFSQEDSSDTRGKSGTGLGLSISKMIIEKLDGILNFTSTPNEITTFFFDLPLAKQQIDIVAEHDDAASAIKKTLLICEDDKDQSNYLKLLLESAGFIVDVASSATEAKHCLAKQKYHALLLDLILPDQDGITFIRELRAKENTAVLPIIVLSVIAQTGKELSNGDAVAVIDWLDKPINLNKLLISINKINKNSATALPRILHIEDNKDTQKIMEVLLEKHANVSTATSLQEAKSMLEQDKYNLVILDLLLPDGNGIDILPLISKYHAPVLVFSDTKLNEEYAQFVSQALLKSSSSSEALLNTIKQLL